MAIKAGIKWYQGWLGIFASGVERLSTGLESSSDPSDIVQCSAECSSPSHAGPYEGLVSALPLESPERRFEPGIAAVAEGKGARASISGYSKRSVGAGVVTERAW